jgi:hypothetical protein
LAFRHVFSAALTFAGFDRMNLEGNLSVHGIITATPIWPGAPVQITAPFSTTFALDLTTRLDSLSPVKESSFF